MLTLSAIVIPSPSGHNTYYIPMDGPWDSPEDNEAYKLANAIFDRERGENEYAVLIISHHWTASGYWIETQDRPVLFPDRILKGGHTIDITPKIGVILKTKSNAKRKR